MKSYGATVLDHPASGRDPDLEPRPRRAPPGHWPDFTTYYLRYPAGLREVVRVVFGASGPSAAAFVDRLIAALHGADGPMSIERGRVLVPRDPATQVVFAYWDDAEAHRRWVADWAGPGVECGVAWWCETAELPLTHTETHFGVRVRQTGLGRIAGTEHEFCPMVGYWGSARDRIPASADDDLLPGASVPAVGGGPGDRRVVAPHNAATIRTSQDWCGAPADHVEWYRTEVEPTLRAGVEHLCAQADDAGCISARYVRETDLEGRDVDRTCVLASFRSLGHLELWARDHPTHHAIFVSGMAMVRRFGEQLGIRLFHEVSALPEGRYRGRYVACDAQEGLLRRLAGDAPNSF